MVNNLNNAVKDRNLLEWAAKAAGYDTSHRWNAERMELNPPVIGLCISGAKGRMLWNPLEDDGDAFHLAVKLRLKIEHCCNPCNQQMFVAVRTYGPFWHEYQEKYEGNDTAATRRAIVRAAAAIGKEEE
jgi:hypothetical protein